MHDHCSVCRKHKRNTSKPNLGLPKAREVNETVCIDLKPVATLLSREDRRQVVYMVDSFSNFTAAGISRSKEAEAVAEVILRKWCLGGGGLGYPSRSFFCDNGNEFRKEFLEETSRRLSIKIQLTPSYSPWSNGGCERRHGAIDLTIKKSMDDDKSLKLEEALEHALWARNMEIGRHGLSPYQVVYGKSPVLPGITEGTPMTDSLITQADAVRLHFQRQETARAELRKYDSSRRLKEALKARLQPYFDVKYEEGDLIIFQDGNDQWNGPAEVKTMDSKTLFVIHNGQLKKVATCRARPWVEESEVESSESSENEDDLEEESLIENSEQLEIPSSEQESSKRMENESGKVSGTEKSARSRGSSKECSNRMENETALMPSEGIVPEESARRMESVETEEEASSILETRQESSRRMDNEVPIQEHNNDLLQNKERRPKRGSMVIFQKDGETSKQSGRVKFVGKGTGKKKNTCWIEINGEIS